MTEVPNPIAIYVHWPFCESKCPYCDFNSHVAQAADLGAFQKAYLTEISYFKDILAGRTVSSIFFGGGTPSLAPPSFFSAVIEHIASLSTLAPNIEITMEANPGSVEVNKFADFSAAGINRVSIGVQSFNDEKLRFLGRKHDSAKAKYAISVAAKYFANYSFDLIYALPEQTILEWRSQLLEALTFTNGHLSLYQLTIEKGTKFFNEHRSGSFILPEDEHAAELYLATQEIMDNAGMPAYEISNHAKPGYESMHNLHYWRYGDYLGIGAGAHGRYIKGEQRFATVMHHMPQKWQTAVEQQEVGFQSKLALSNIEQKEEKLLMGIRISEGVDPRLIPQEIFEELRALKLLEIFEGRIRLTKEGRLVANAVTTHIISKYKEVEKGNGTAKFTESSIYC
jgi:oxygen-independent coproporphyrinogen-3 oxidase